MEFDKDKIIKVEKFERCRHLLDVITETLELTNPSWEALVTAYTGLGEELGMGKIAEQIIEEAVHNPDNLDHEVE